MPNSYDNYNIFISSPGDVSQERKIAEKVILDVDKTIKETLKISLDSLMWEKTPPVTTNLPDEKIQDVINKDVVRADFFILILHKRYGRIEKGSNISNTEREIEAILKQHQQSPNSIKILVYFKNIDSNKDPGEQENKVVDLRRRLDELGIFRKSFSDSLEFSNLLTHDLYNVILKLRFSSTEIPALQHFWKFAKVARNTHPHVAIIFQPVNREFMNHHGINGDENVWIKRLQPNIYFEDYRALHKIQNNLSLVGMDDHRVYFHTDTPQNLKDLNRIWICFPRSRKALEQLEQLNKNDPNKLNFKFEPRQKQENRIKWRIPGTDEWFYVHSPLSKYLNDQRKNIDPTQDWTPNLGRVVAKIMQSLQGS
jgi:hypothetical protein